MGPRRGGGTTVAMRDARWGGGRQLIRRGGMHVGRQRRRLASLGPERRVDFYPENPPTAGSLVSNYRNAVALGHSCLALLSSTSSASPPFVRSLWSSLSIYYILFIEQTYLSLILNSIYTQGNYFISNPFDLQSIWMEVTKDQWISFWSV